MQPEGYGRVDGATHCHAMDSAPRITDPIWRGVCRGCNGTAVAVIEPPGIQGASIAAKHVSVNGKLRAERVDASMYENLAGTYDAELNTGNEACRCEAGADLVAVVAWADRYAEGMVRKYGAELTRTRVPCPRITLRRALIAHHGTFGDEKVHKELFKALTAAIEAPDLRSEIKTAWRNVPLMKGEAA